jgi:hypothetical protein
MIYQITGFTKFNNREKSDHQCLAITQEGREILVDPFVSCAFPYDRRQELIGKVFQTTNQNFSGFEGSLLPLEGDFIEVKSTSNNN